MSEWLDNMLNPKISKEASQTDAKQEFDKKIAKSEWLGDVMELDEIKLRAEAEQKLQAELAVRDEHLKKQAAYEAFETCEETLKRDYARDVAILSDYALAEMIAEVRGHNNQDFMENASEYKEKAKKDIKSDRKAVEKELLENVGLSAQVDWQKAFEKYQKEEKPKEPKEKSLYEPKLEKVDDKLSEGGKEKDYSQTDKEHIESMQGVGREEDKRTEVTEQAGEVKKDASLEKKARAPFFEDFSAEAQERILNNTREYFVAQGLKDIELDEEVSNFLNVHNDGDSLIAILNGRIRQLEASFKTAALVRDPDVELKVGTLITLARSVMAKDGTILPEGSKWQIKSIDGFHYNITDDKNTYVISSHDTPKMDKLAAQEEIKNQATPEQVLEIIKKAEISSPWKVVVDPETNKEVIARIDSAGTTKESTEDKENLNK
jgi:hypothetical protein